MEDLPPTYENAVSREPWNIIAPYIYFTDLCSACLVNRKWHTIFAPTLWGNPASHFGLEHDAAYGALTKFQSALPRARQLVRQLTHTIRLSPAASEIDGEPDASWLRHLLEYLPNLQSLIVSHLSSFDHQSLVDLTDAPETRSPKLTSGGNLPHYGLKLLLAESEINATPTGLRKALLRLSRLVYLDLSHTSSARDDSVLYGLSSLRDLQVLKLRGVGLRDREAGLLATAIGTRVRLLDVCQNYLTDTAARALASACFFPHEEKAGTPRAGEIDRNQSTGWPIGGTPAPAFLSLDLLQSENLDEGLLKQLTLPLTGRLALEDIPHRGLTHLYISGNSISAEGLSALLESTRLYVLDGGSAMNLKTSTPAASSSASNSHQDHVHTLSARRLISVLKAHASGNLIHLRIDHTVVTDPNLVDEGLQPQPSSTGLESRAPTDVRAAVLDPPIAELFDGNKMALETDPVTHIALSDPLISPSAPTLRVGLIESLLRKRPSQLLSLAALSSPSMNQPSNRSLSQHQNSTVLHPSQLPHLRTLVLTNVPCYVLNKSPVVPTLLRFISACADEAHLALLQAQTNYSLPPGHRREAAEIQYARSLFALKTIVLEMADNNDAKRSGSTPHAPTAMHHMKSSTGDVDSEALWVAAKDDFSFFNEQDRREDAEGHQIYLDEAEGESRSPRPGVAAIPPPSAKVRLESGNPDRTLKARITPVSDPATLPSSGKFKIPVTTTKQEDRQTLDVIAELSKFRKHKRVAYQRASAAARATPKMKPPTTGTKAGGDGIEREDQSVEVPLLVEGYWEGEIRIIRERRG